MYFRIKQYCNIIPDYALYFTFAKRKSEWHFIYPKFWKDLLQIIALCIFENDTLKKRNNAIGKELYKFARHVLDLPCRENNKYHYKSICKKITKCWICKKNKKEYMRQSLTPGHKICGACYQRIYKQKRKGVVFMNPFDLIANAIKKYPDIYISNKTEKGICCVTGMECQTIRRKDIFSANFTNANLLKAPDSDRIGICAAIVLKYRPERSSWFANEREFVRFDKNLFRDMFLNGIKNSKYWSIYITTSYKKHGAFFAKVNSCSNGNRRKYGIWRFEQLDVDASDGRKNKNWYKIISMAYIENEISRKVMETLDCPGYIIKKIGIGIWLKFHSWAKDKYQNPLYKLCCYLLPSQEDLKNESK